MNPRLWRAGLRIALRSLSMHKLRSGLTMLGMVIGVAAVVAMISIGSGAEARIREQIKGLGSNLLVVIPGSITSGGTRLGVRTRSTLTQEDAVAMQAEIAEVAMAAPALHGSGQVVAGNRNWSTVFHGVNPDYLEARNWSVAQGGGFSAADVASGAKVVLLGTTVAENLFGHQDPLGATLRIAQVPMTVVGVLEQRGQNLSGVDQDDMVVMPLATARRRVMRDNALRQRPVHTIMVKAHEGASLASIEEAIKDLLRQRHRIRPGSEDDFSVRNLAQVAAAERAASRVMTLLLAAIAGVSLVVGGIGIMNILLVSVRERTREIGIRRAVGARKSDILLQFLLEAITLAALGGLCGIALGVASAYTLARISGWPIEVGIESLALALGFAAAIGMVFGIYPANQAARLRPMNALRFE